jgi:hypothetical protein
MTGEAATQLWLLDTVDESHNTQHQIPCSNAKRVCSDAKRVLRHNKGDYLVFADSANM